MKEIRKPILDVLNGRKAERVPFWLMRQAGRYLPEYRALRSEAGSFLDLVYDPEKAAEVTVQPLRRFGMDAAILFSDILVVPDALGQSVRFETGEGPRLDPLETEKDLLKLDPDKTGKVYSRVFETVEKTCTLMKSENFDQTALIGFCGSPWTVACYMVEGKGSKDFEKARHKAYEDDGFFEKLIDLLVESSCAYLSGQIKAGAEVIQLFDSWSGLLDANGFEQWVIEPTRKIRAFLKIHHPDIPVIGFPRGAGTMLLAYAQKTGVNCVGLDPSVSPVWAKENLQKILPVQGNLDPVRLLCGGMTMEDAMKDIYSEIDKSCWIFNLGHGVIKETDIDSIHQLAKIVRSWKI